LIWGRNDKITPPEVAVEFHELLPDSELHWIDKCGHAPMMEHPEEFNTLLKQFLAKLETKVNA
jgi:pimeloyl-ACP methyl ester carboxylesterase